jgi:hypothetical protein
LRTPEAQFRAESPSALSNQPPQLLRCAEARRSRPHRRRTALADKDNQAMDDDGGEVLDLLICHITLEVMNYPALPSR